MATTDGASSPFVRPTSKSSSRSLGSRRSQHSNASSESTPLLSREEGDNGPSYSGTEAGNGTASPATQSLRSIQDGSSTKTKHQKRWATILSLSILSIVVVLILCLGFAAPAVVEEYAKEAIVFEPTNLAIDSFTATGVRARVEGDFVLDATRVKKKSVRDLGKAGTWIAKEIESTATELKVYLPSYENLLLGTAKLPSIKLNIQSQHVNHISIGVDLAPGDVDGLRRLANDWLNGDLGQLKVLGIAQVGLKSGIFRLPQQTISQSLFFEGHDLPNFPELDITRLNFYEVDLPRNERGMAADASISLANDYPVRFDVPLLSFDILVPNCAPDEEFLSLAQAETYEIQIRPKQSVDVDVSAIVRELPEALTNACPDSNSSPLDVLVANYLEGHDTTIYIRGSDAHSPGTPGWITELIHSVVVPLPLPGHPFGNLIRNFSLSDVHFSLPSPWAEKGTPESKPRVSALVKALVALPKEMNFPLNVSQVRADADVYYHGSKLGRLDLHKWQDANASRVEDISAGAALLVQSAVEKAPLDITDDDLFSDLVQKLVFGSDGVVLTVKADVDVRTATALGDFVVREIPAQGKVFVKPISGGSGFSGLTPKIGDLEIVNTTAKSIALRAKVNIINPTPYSASIPRVRINILNNDTVLGHAIAEDLEVQQGNNTNLAVNAIWNPTERSGLKGGEIGRDLLSKYLSGYNTTLTLKTDNMSIPSQPSLGQALSAIEVVIDTPKLGLPKDGDKGDDDEKHTGPHFIKDATMHLFTSTATFTLISPLPKTTLLITSVNATAFYNHTEIVGTIDYSYPFKVPPGASMTPRLPVDWTLGGAGYNAVRDALGGELKLDAKADVGIKIGEWTQMVWYEGSGIGAKVRL